MRLPLIYVEWDDHHASGAWREGVEHAPSKCASVGWLIKEDRKAISLVSSVSLDHDSNTTGNSQYILKNCITKRKLVRRANVKAN